MLQFPGAQLLQAAQATDEAMVMVLLFGLCTSETSLVGALEITEVTALVKRTSPGTP